MAFKIDELFYELDARTSGFEDKITRSQRSLDDFASFVKQKPLLAVAALGASLLAIAAAAVHMADEVDTQMRRVQAAFPGATKEVDKLRQLVEDISEITPRSQAELASAAAAIAEKGVESVNEIQLRLRKAVDIADATGTDLVQVIDGLDNVGDAFGLTAGKAADELTRIFGAAQGKVGLDEVFATLEKGGSVLASLGVEAHDAGDAMIALIDAGVPRKQAGTVLTTILELTNRVKQLRAAGGEQAEIGKIIEGTLSRQNVAAKGLTGALAEFAGQVQRGGRDLNEFGIRSNVVNAIQRVAASTMNDTRTEAEKLADAQAKLERSAATNRESASALAKILRNELAESLIRLGNDLLPAAIKLIDGLTAAMRRLKGEGNPLRDVATLAGKVPVAEPLGRNNFRRGTRFETDDEKQAGEFQEALKGTITRVERVGADAFSGFTPEKLQQVKDNLTAFVRAHADQARDLSDGIVKVGVALNQAIEAAKAEQAKGTEKPKPTKEHVAELTASVRDAIAGLERGIASALTGETETKIDDAQQRVAAFRAEVEKLAAQSGANLDKLKERGTAQLEGATTQVETKERAEAARKVADEVAQAIGVQSVIMQQGLKDFLADVEKRNAEYAKLGLAPLFTPEQVQAVRDIRQALIDATLAAEQADKAIVAAHAAAEPAGGGRGNMMKAAGLLSDEIERLDKQRTATSADNPAGLEKRKRLQAEINKLQQELNALQARNQQQLEDAATAEQTRLALLQETAQAINSAVGLALQLGQAFGLVSANVASMLQGITNGASAVGPFMETLKSYKKGGEGAASIGQLVGAAAPVVGGIVSAVGLISSLFGESPEDKERKRLQKENNAALDRLTSRIGDLGKINVTGEEYSKVSDALEAYFHQSSISYGLLVGRENSVNEFLKQFGLTADQFREYAKQFGVTIGDNIRAEDFENLRKAIQASELTSFGDTFAGQLQEMDAEIKLFDLKDPIKQLELFRKALDKIKGGGGILQETLDKFDLSTAEGVQAAQEALQKLFQQLQEGSLDPAALGGLTAQQFLEALLKASDLLKSTTPAGTGGFNVDRSITEATGSHLAGLFTTGNYIAERTAAAAESILELLQELLQGDGSVASRLPAIQPPLVPSGGFSSGALAGGAGGVDTLEININLNLPAEFMTAAGQTAAIAAAEEIGDRAAQAISQRLATFTRRRRSSNGETTLH
jgi:TP901 family phage tail tape measure protein